jgi:RNA polymerase sigma factor (sigma-70 family)
MVAVTPRRRKLGLIEYQVGDEWVTQLCQLWPPPWPPWHVAQPGWVPLTVALGRRMTPFVTARAIDRHVIDWARREFKRSGLDWLRRGWLLPAAALGQRLALWDPSVPAEPGLGLLAAPPRIKPPQPGAPFDSHLIWQIEKTLKIFEPLPRKRTRTGIVKVGGSAVELLATLILLHSPSWPHEKPVRARYPEPAALVPTKPPREPIHAAVEQQIVAFGATPFFTPEMHDAIERVHRAVMEHNIAVSSAAYNEAFFKIGGKYQHHRQNAEDLSQRTKLRILERFDRLSPWRVPNALMAKACERLFKNDYKKQAREAEDSTEYIVNNKLATPATQDWDEETIGQILKLADMPQGTQVLVIRRGQGASYKELAAHFDVSIGTIGSRLSKAYQQLNRLHEGKRPIEDVPAPLPLGLVAEQWVDPHDVGDGSRRKFDPAAGFGGARSDQVADGKVPGFGLAGGYEQDDDERLSRGSNRKKYWEPPPPSFYGGIRAHPDPDRHIPVTPQLNEFYLEMLQYAHWRALARGLTSYCYAGCGCIGTRYEAIVPVAPMRGVMDAIEAGWELPQDLQKWRRKMVGAEPSYVE